MKKEQKKLSPFELEARKIVIIYIIDNLFAIHSLVLLYLIRYEYSFILVIV